ncbi:uncharacterized protein sS8_1036 [Methylocaldum marinum]|uniref:Uncharacterized protein n=1 Tax=Methylocaldum marinum TaxID=1432792 RepID=A0A250KN26_9GAMM|nr:uncharacterized protein sS8_1036 [Methylocaldum marinum]
MRPLMRMWWLHFGQTSKFLSTSDLYKIALQAGHLLHKPSGIALLDDASVRIFEGTNL